VFNFADGWRTASPFALAVAMTRTVQRPPRPRPPRGRRVRRKEQRVCGPCGPRLRLRSGAPRAESNRLEKLGPADTGPTPTAHKQRAGGGAVREGRGSAQKARAEAWRKGMQRRETDDGLCRMFFQGKADGQRSAVWIRARLQDQLSQLGYFLQRHAGKVLFVAILALATFCVALKSVQVHSRVDQLWVQGKSPRSVATTLLSVAWAEIRRCGSRRWFGIADRFRGRLFLCACPCARVPVRVSLCQCPASRSRGCVGTGVEETRARATSA
jgi:hypothetical protein